MVRNKDIFIIIVFMIYNYRNRLTGEIKTFGSLVALCNDTGMKIGKFYKHFGFRKRKVYEGETFEIHKGEIIRSKRKN